MREVLLRRYGEMRWSQAYRVWKSVEGTSAVARDIEMMVTEDRCRGFFNARSLGVLCLIM